jgi:hypothetical protein
MPSADTAPAELLPWDSDFWGLTIGRVVDETLTPERARAIDAWAELNGVDCLYFLASAEDAETILAAEDAGYRLVEIRVELRRARAPVDWDRLPAQHESIVVRESRPEDLEALRRIALRSYYDSRFYIDPNFPRERVGELYATWVQRTMEGWRGETVLVAELSGNPAGFASVGVEEGGSFARTSLIAVDQDLMKGTLAPRVSHALALALLRWAEERKVGLRCFTQGRNVRAQRYIQRHGFFVHGISIYFHKWYR